MSLNGMLFNSLNAACSAYWFGPFVRPASVAERSGDTSDICWVWAEWKTGRREAWGNVLNLGSLQPVGKIAAKQRHLSLLGLVSRAKLIRAKADRVYVDHHLKHFE
jgi:hypothetical protein